MKKTEILVIGRHPEILATVIRLINQNPAWNGTGCLTDEEAKECFNQNHFDLVLLGGGVEEVSEKNLRLFFGSSHPHIPVIQHYGGGSGLLSNEIMEALNKK